MKFLIGFLVTIGLLIVVFILIFRGSANNDQTTQEQVRLPDYADSTTVMQFTEMGSVIADQEHYSVRITVSNVETSIEAFKGYQNALITSRTFANNSTAYGDFLSALQIAGYNVGTTGEGTVSEQGQCATGVRYIMGIRTGSDTIQDFWSSSCKLKNETFQGNTSSVRNLFHAQVPGYSTILNEADVNL